jgi:murein DD-endopeptidase MepM/ murein hydrolase activator NlpD
MRPLRHAGAILAVAFAGCEGGGNGAGGASLCGPYPAQSSSPYVLPFQVGQAYELSQGNCASGSHAPGTIVQHAYDFRMPIGTPVIAAREGAVLLVEERFADRNRTPGEENFINVTHADGTIAAYVHLTRDGASVEVGDVIQRGELIGSSGDTGSSTEPHLHFHVQRCSGCETIPVSFLNTRPHPNGLVEGETYTAEAY